MILIMQTTKILMQNQQGCSLDLEEDLIFQQNLIFKKITMKKITTLILSLLTIVSFSQDIATARTQGIGATVTITGIVTNGDELGPIRYIEDGTGGLALYDPTTLGSVVRGDEITVTGVLIDYNGLLEMLQLL